MAYNQTVLDLTNPDRVQLDICQAPDAQPEWRVRYPAGTKKRLDDWRNDPVMPPLIQALNQVPGVLLPKELSPKTGGEYRIEAPEGTWIPAWELRDIRSLHCRQISIMDLWKAAAALCDTLAALHSLGVWGWSKRGKLLLHIGKKSGGRPRFCLTDIVDYNIFRFSQVRPKLPETKEDAVTQAFRILLGETALCADSWTALHGRENATPLELQLGAECVGMLSAFFRAPSTLSPQPFLRQAKNELISVAESLAPVNPREFHLYIVLLGGSCCQADIPALSSVIRAFQRSVESLQKSSPLALGKATCIFPWDSVQIRYFDPNIILGLSALPWQEMPQRQVSWGGLLDCLDQELERDASDGAPQLVCCIELPEGAEENRRRLSCMEQYLSEKLKRKTALGAFKLLVCNSGIRQPSQLTDHLIAGEGNRRNAQLVTDPEELSPKLYAALKELLDEPKYILKSPEV